MVILSWQEEYSVGVKEMDAEHAALVDMISRAHEAANGGLVNIHLMIDVVHGMADYAKVHFATEESLMKEHCYPGLHEHVSQHEAFVEQVENYKRKPFQEWEKSPTKVFRFLADWLVDHILGTDKELGAFLNEKGVK